MRVFESAIALCWAIVSLSSTVDAFQSSLEACPNSCHGASDEWTLYSSTDRLQSCHSPMLLDFHFNPDLHSPGRTTKLFTCTLNGTSNATSSTSSAHHAETHNHHGTSHKRLHSKRSHPTCLSGQEHTVSVDLSVISSSGTASSENLEKILGHIRDHFTNTLMCDTKHIFGYYNGAAIGVYIGSAVDNVESTSSFIKLLQDQATQDRNPQSVIMQRCKEVPNSDYIIGFAIDTTGDLASVQNSVNSWNNAKCVPSTGVNTKLNDVRILEAPLGLGDGTKNKTIHNRESLAKRGDCTTKSVISGDSCGSMASKCGISAADFTKYNPDKSLCSSLTVGQRVCCSAGTVPDIAPKANEDGSCHVYKVTSADNGCDSIAAANGLKSSDISKFNDKTTWGWFGCDDLQAGINICLSEGDPPMPAAVANSQCGPTVSGTKMPTNGTKLADLNPCPLNSCCDIWGQCGITPEYCTNVTGPTGNPGTAPTNQNGCISNCGTKIEKSKYTPDTFLKIGYYETWNYDRPCLNLRVASVGVIDYTHIHWAFGSVTEDFNVTINDTYNQWDSFTSMPTVKKIISFGGWGDSTSPATYNRLRNAMKPENADKFAENIFNFVETNGLDGVDFDWEYPGATDIPNIPKGLESDGANYLSFLKKMKSGFPIGKSVSIAAPASYWYLKSFPIGEMSKTLDYIVYMTYDLHGQWDYGKQWTQEGCSNGDCLRSQVNLTETNYALSMVTKAGVDSNKIMVGIPSYGRSFGMEDESCTGPDCHYTGTNTHSDATEGRCTKTAGIIAQAEINQILALETQTKTFYDSGSDSNILVWNNTWAAFMDHDTLTSRTDYYKSLNFGGLVDWAVDLKEFTNDDGNPDDDDEDDEDDIPDLADCFDEFDNLEDLADASDSIPQHCVAQYTMETLYTMMGVAMANYTDLMDDGYDNKFKIFSKSVAGNAQSSVHNFMNNNGSDYFTCEVDETTMCCDTCKAKPELYNCDWCFKGDCYESCDSYLCRHGGSLKKKVIKYKRVTEPCPPDYSKRGTKERHEESVHWSLDDDKASQFWADLESTTGISKDHIEFGIYDRDGGCTPGDKVGNGADCWNLGYDFNIPMPKNYKASDVANPKDTAKKGLEKSNNLLPQISNAILEINTDAITVDGMDLIDSISVPVLMVVQAIEEMSKVETIAEKITATEKKKKKEEAIGGFLAALLFMIPVAGEVLGSVAGMAEAGVILSLAGDAANIGLSVSEIVKDPKNAPLEIMGIVFGTGALGDTKRVARAASLRRAMKEVQVAKLGERVSSRLSLIEKVTGKCSV